MDTKGTRQTECAGKYTFVDKVSLFTPTCIEVEAASLKRLRTPEQ